MPSTGTDEGAKLRPLLGVNLNDAASYCLEHNCLDRSLVCPVCLRSERFSYVVVIQMASSQCPQRLIESFMASRRDRQRVSGADFR